MACAKAELKRSGDKLFVLDLSEDEMYHLFA
jgi:hypothetical protein